MTCTFATGKVVFVCKDGEAGVNFDPQTDACWLSTRAVPTMGGLETETTTLSGKTTPSSWQPNLGGED